MLKLVAFTSDVHTYDISNTVDNNKENPLVVTADSINGSKIIRKIILSNIDQDKKYSDTTVSIDISGEAIDIPDDVIIKLIAAETKPSESDFDEIGATLNEITIADEILPNSSITVWLFVSYPGALSLNILNTIDVTLDDLLIKVDTTEEAV